MTWLHFWEISRCLFVCFTSGLLTWDLNVQNIQISVNMIRVSGNNTKQIGRIQHYLPEYKKKILTNLWKAPVRHLKRKWHPESSLENLFLSSWLIDFHWWDKIPYQIMYSGLTLDPPVVHLDFCKHALYTVLWFLTVVSNKYKADHLKPKAEYIWVQIKWKMMRFGFTF